MKKCITRPLAILLCVVVAAACTDGPRDTQFAAVTDTADRWVEYYEAGDLENLMTLYADDVFVALHGQPVLFGKDAVRDFFAPRIGKLHADVEVQHEAVVVKRGIAYIISKYWLYLANEETGGVFKDAGRSLLIYENRDGRWLIVADLDQATPDVTWPSPGGRD